MTAASLYLYAICQIPSKPIELPLGLEGNTLLVSVADVGAIAEPAIDLATLQSDDQRLLTAVLSHDRVIGEIFQQTVVLPLRFGTQMTSQAGLKAHLQENLSAYQGKLAALAGKVEHQVRLEPTQFQQSPLPEYLKGRDYFRAKKQRLQEQTTALQAQQADLIRLLEQIQQAYPAYQQEVQDDSARAFVLIDRTATEKLQQDAQGWQADIPTWQITLSEALPPYHFV